MSVELTPGGTRGVELPRFARWLVKPMMGLSLFAFRRFGSRMKVQGRPLLLLTTVGAKTGRRRESVLAWFADPGREDTFLVVGSGGGSARHPGWCYNLAKHPDQVWIKVGGRELKIWPESLRGAEREEAWKRVVALAPGYGSYEVKTDRQIPIIRLTPSMAEGGEQPRSPA